MRDFFAKVPMFLYIVETIIRTIRDIRMFGWTTATLSVGDLVYMICVCVCVSVNEGIQLKMAWQWHSTRSLSVLGVCVYVRVVDVIIIILIVAPASPRLLLLVDWRCVVVAVVDVVDYDTIHTLLLSLLFYFLLCVAKRSVHSKREHLLLLLLLFLPLFLQQLQAFHHIVDFKPQKMQNKLCFIFKLDGSS